VEKAGTSVADATQIRAFSLGKSQPTLESRKREAANRRVEIYVNRRERAFELPAAVVKPTPVVTMPPPTDPRRPTPSHEPPSLAPGEPDPTTRILEKVGEELRIPRPETLDRAIDLAAEHVANDPRGIVPAMADVAEWFGVPHAKAKAALREAVKGGTRAAIKAAIKTLVEHAAGPIPDPMDSVISLPPIRF
jgi:hypothetical protein